LNNLIDAEFSQGNILLYRGLVVVELAKVYGKLENAKWFLNLDKRDEFTRGSLMRHGVDDVNHCPVGNPKRKV
jgi:hypothetical protein